MQSNLRMVILVVGIVFVLGVVGFEWYKRSRMEQQKRNRLSHPPTPSDLKEDPLFTESGSMLKSMPESISVQPEPAQERAIPEDPEPEITIVSKKRRVSMEESLVISLSILSRSRKGFSGRALLHALKREQLEFGERNIFHRHATDDASCEARSVLFSLASMTSPGYF